MRRGPPLEIVPAGETDLGHGVVTVDDALAEPGAKPRGERCCARYIRTYIADCIPVAVGVKGAAADRLEMARIPVVADGADLDAVREEAYPAHTEVRAVDHGLGSCVPSLVVVDARLPVSGLPQFSPSTPLLLEALRIMGYDELAVYFTWTHEKNRRCDEAIIRLVEAFAPSEPTWLALGEFASGALERMGVRHSHAQHPTYHWRYVEGSNDVKPAKYAAHMEERGVPHGPWRGGSSIHTVPSDRAPALAESFGIPRTAAYRPEAKHKTTTSRGTIDRVKANAARLSYMVGHVVDPADMSRPLLDKDGEQIQARSVQAIARALKINKSRLMELSYSERWDVERDAFLERTRTEALDEAQRRTVDGVGDSATAAWENLSLGLASLRLRQRAAAGDLGAVAELDRLNADMKKAGLKHRIEPMSPNARDVESIGRLAVALSTVQLPDGDDRPRELPTPREVAQRYGEFIKGVIGDAPLRRAAELEAKVGPDGVAEVAVDEAAPACDDGREEDTR